MNVNAMRCAQVALAVLFMGAGAAKLAGAHVMIQQFEVIGIGQAARYIVGSFEIVADICLLSTRLAACGALLVSCITVGVIGATIGHAARVVNKTPPVVEPQPTLSSIRHASVAHPSPGFDGGRIVVALVVADRVGGVAALGVRWQAPSPSPSARRCCTTGVGLYGRTASASQTSLLWAVLRDEHKRGGPYRINA